MKVYGYTEDKDVVQVDLSIDEIVSAGIDPWRLDLFDSSPLTVQVQDRLVYFRRLQDVAFTYGQGKQKFVCVHDGSDAVCLEGLLPGAVWEDNSAQLHFRNIEKSPKPFKEHLQAYLQQLSWWSEVFSQAGSRTPRICYLPQPAAAVDLQGATLRFDLGLRFPQIEIKTPVFTGRMFDELSVGILLSNKVNEILATLAPWHPQVEGEAVRRSLRHQELTCVRFALDNSGLNFAMEKFAGGTLFGQWYTFKHGGCTYELRLRRSGARRSLRDSIAPADLYSAEAVYSCLENEVRGCRVALFDISRLQTRLLHNPRRSPFERDSNANCEQLKKEGFTVLEVK